MKKRGNFGTLVWHDICYFMRLSRAKWFLAWGIQLFLCFRSLEEVSFRGASDLLSALWPVMSGSREYLVSQDRAFELPALWFLFHLYLSFLIGFYPAGDLGVGNGQTLVRTRTRAKWLMSKWLGAGGTILLYYGCFLLFLLIGNGRRGGSLLPASGILEAGGILLFERSFPELFLAFFLLPLLVSLALGTVQIVLSLFAGPVFAFMGMTAYLIASVFWKSPFLLGNFSMLYRQDWVCGGSGISLEGGIGWCLALTASACVLGCHLFSRKDVLPTV